MVHHNNEIALLLYLKLNMANNINFDAHDFTLAIFQSVYIHIVIRL